MKKLLFFLLFSSFSMYGQNNLMVLPIDDANELHKPLIDDALTTYNTTRTPCIDLVSTFPYTESFENTLGSWLQESNDDFDWFIHSGSTPSVLTGPSAASHGSYYLYMESSITSLNQKTILNSPCFNLTRVNSPVLSFKYHMYGATMGNLKLEASTNGSSWTTIWSKAGNQGNSWLTATVSLAPYTNASNLRLRFNGAAGISWKSDMAIDDFSITGAAVSPPCSNLVSTFPYTESFENTLGAWSQESNDDFDWFIHSGSTPSVLTGPSAASHGSYYLYMESSITSLNQKTILNSPCFNLTRVNSPVLSFKYHMYGATMGHLKLEASTNGSSWTTIWSKAGNQGNSWLTATVSLAPYTNANNLRLRFNGAAGVSWKSDMAIDDFSITGAAVSPPCNNLVSTFPYTESFENTLGAWSQESNDDFDWFIHSGSTPSVLTGPSAASHGSYYLYMESSITSLNQKTILNSPCFNLTRVNSPVLSFKYHMYGATMGHLKLEVSTNGSSWTTIWSKSGNQGNSWLTATVSLAPYTNANNLRLRFNGAAGISWKSDMAIDDFSIRGILNKVAENQAKINQIKDFGSSSFLTLAPNPFNDYLDIETNIKNLSQYSVMNLQGQVIQTGILNNNRIQLPDLARGIYFISFTNGKEQIVRKVTKN